MASRTIAVAVCALLALLTLASAQSCKSYERTHFDCNVAAGKCCQKGLECKSANGKATCEVPPPTSGATTAPGTAAPPCATYERTHFDCNLPAGKCCQKGLECKSANGKATCEVPPPTSGATTIPGSTTGTSTATPYSTGRRML